MTTAVVPMIDPAVVERVLLQGDLRQLSAAQKVSYYKSVCESVGLNPLTQPFQYLVLNGKEILYASRSALETRSRRDAIDRLAMLLRSVRSRQFCAGSWGLK